MVATHTGCATRFSRCLGVACLYVGLPRGPIRCKRRCHCQRVLLIPGSVRCFGRCLDLLHHKSHDKILRYNAVRCCSYPNCRYSSSRTHMARLSKPRRREHTTYERQVDLHCPQGHTFLPAHSLAVSVDYRGRVLLRRSSRSTRVQLQPIFLQSMYSE